MDLDKILKAIADVRNRIVREGAINNPHLLSERMAELALFNHMLSDYLADSRLDARRAQAECYHRLVAEGNSTNQSMIASRMDPSILEADNRADKVDVCVKQTANLITALQSHLKAKLNELSSQGSLQT